MQTRRFSRRDGLLLGAMALAGAILALVLLLTGKRGAVAEVRVGSKVVADYPLNENGYHLIEGAEGGYNLLVIQDGKAWVEEASCPDGLCIGMGKIALNGQAVVCLPNQVVVEISGAAQSAEVDFVVGGRQ